MSLAFAHTNKILNDTCAVFRDGDFSSTSLAVAVLSPCRLRRELSQSPLVVELETAIHELLRVEQRLRMRR